MNFPTVLGIYFQAKMHLYFCLMSGLAEVPKEMQMQLIVVVTVCDLSE